MPGTEAPIGRSTRSRTGKAHAHDVGDRLPSARCGPARPHRRSRPRAAPAQAALGQTSAGDDNSEGSQAQNDPIRVLGEYSWEVGWSEDGAGLRVESSSLCARNSERTGSGADQIRIIGTRRGESERPVPNHRDLPPIGARDLAGAKAGREPRSRGFVPMTRKTTVEATSNSISAGIVVVLAGGISVLTASRPGRVPIRAAPPGRRRHRP
jgi:hypothetical protein